MGQHQAPFVLQIYLIWYRTLSHLDAANHDRFVRLREVAREQATGSGDSDLRRMKRQFASLKNTFILYDVKQSFIEGTEALPPQRRFKQTVPGAIW